jgi:hypothetical protein
VKNPAINNQKQTNLVSNGKSSKWKEESEAFRESMRAARMVNQAIANGQPLPPPSASIVDSSLIPCPHCSRRYNSKAAERHIPQCKNIIAKPSSLKRGGGVGGGVGSTVSIMTPQQKNTRSNSTPKRGWQ